MTFFSGDFPEMSADELTLRRLLWLRHGCAPHTLYGDDGELQCATCMLDFRRMSAREIDQRFYDIGVRKLAAAQAAVRATEQGATP